MVNVHNPAQLQYWRANCDLQVILDAHACKEYLTKYITKAEKRSQNGKYIVSKILESLEETVQKPSHSLIRKLLISDLKQRDICAQECSYRLTGGYLVHHKDLKFIRFNLNGNSKIEFDQQTSKLIEKVNLKQLYAQRMKFQEKFTDHDFETMNLDRFVRTFYEEGGRLVQRPVKTITFDQTGVQKTVPTLRGCPLVIDFFPKGYGRKGHAKYVDYLLYIPADKI